MPLSLNEAIVGFLAHGELLLLRSLNCHSVFSFLLCLRLGLDFHDE